MRSLEDLLAVNAWAQGLTPEQLQRVRTSVVVHDFAAEAYACHAGDPANVWIGVIDGLVRMISQALQVLEKAGLIKVDYRIITMLDIEGLRRFGT
jgi:hypothetical protein